MTMTFYLNATPLHPTGYPRFYKDKRTNLNEPFLIRTSCGGPRWKSDSAQTAQDLLAHMRSLQLDMDQYDHSARYRLSLELTQG